MTVLLTALVGLLAGVHSATWGMYKDSPHEGFLLRKYVRSPILGLLLGAMVHLATGLDPWRANEVLVLFGVVYAIERALAEIYKTFLREEDQSKYFIPMQFHVLGTVVRSRAARLIAGSCYVALLIGLMGCVSYLDRDTTLSHSLVTVLAVSGVGGWISAFGGAWKDAPSEGFQTLKFFRSPALATLFGLGLAGPSGNLLHVTLAATGYTIATTETYKTFFFPSKPRGKFAGMPVRFPDMLVRRQRFAVLYAAIWVGVLAVAWEAARG